MIDEKQVSDVTLEVWSTMLGTAPTSVDARPVDGLVSASVSISGAWNGTILVNCSTSLALEVARTMFELELDDLEEELVADAVGELANMIGGKLKGTLPGPCVLSMPTVIKHRYFDDVRFPHQVVSAARSFEVNGESLRVAVLMGEAKPVAAAE